jgi:FAD synthetase
MSKVLTAEEAALTSNELRNQGKRIVLAGGCFDILHAGHVKFLEQARIQGDVLFVLLESDESIHKRKGKLRPINSSVDRAIVLSSLENVDYVVHLPFYKDNESYDKLVCRIKPDIIATTKGDPERNHKERQSGLINARVVDVITRIPSPTTSSLAKTIQEKFSE